ncbi:MAG TPA: hypothetical protein DDZ36_08300 [Deltaproteobacteria bacterium]|nr:hypothetical protein [Deltaproteobacteria bacterium]
MRLADRSISQAASLFIFSLLAKTRVSTEIFFASRTSCARLQEVQPFLKYPQLIFLLIYPFEFFFKSIKLTFSIKT